MSIRRLKYLADAGVARKLEAPLKFEKDILRVGRWNVNGEEWNVTRDTLHRIARNFAEGKNRGLDCPVVWNHSDDARDRAGVVESVRVDGDTLTCQFSLIDVERASLVESSGGVSVEVCEPWIDGMGNEYDVMLTHVGIVNHPVIPKQGEFRRLSMSRYAVRRLASGKIVRRRLAEDEELAPDETVEGEESPSETSAIPDDAAAELVPLINQLLPGDVHLPEGTNGANLISNLRIVLETITSITQENAPAEDATETELDAVDVSQMAVDAQKTIGAYRRLLARRREEAARQAQIDFSARLDRLCESGAIEPADKASLLAAGEAAKYSLAILAPFERVSANRELRTRKLAAESNSTPTYSERRRAALRSFGVSTKERK